MASRFDIVTLRAGARAIRDRTSGEIMHPSVGPWAEAERLYVEQSRLAERLLAPGSAPLCVYDVGLGGGANAVAALTCARSLAGRRRGLRVISFDVTLEPFSLALSDVEAFPFLAPWRGPAEALMRDGAWSEGELEWRFLEGDFRSRLANAGTAADLVYFDPFSPKASAECWSAETFAAVKAAMGDPALLLTYSAATPVRASLLLAGLFVGAGASVATKVETTVAATALAELERPLGARWLERWSRSPRFDAHLDARLRAHPQFQTLRKLV